MGIAPHFNLWRALYHLKGHPSSAHHNVVGGAAFSLHQGRSYPDVNLLYDSSKGWNREWFIVSNPAPCLPARTGRVPEYHVCWEELPTEEEMVQVMPLLNEIVNLSTLGLPGAGVALSFS